MKRLNTIERYEPKYLPILKGAFIIILLFIVGTTWYKIDKKNGKEQLQSCKTEDTLEFEGAITEYNGQGFKTSPTVFMIKDSIYTIPRLNIEMRLSVGDTIKKIKGEHSYYLKRTSFSQSIDGKKYDTIIFICP